MKTKRWMAILLLGGISGGIHAQQIDIKGKIADSEAQALVGASVAVYQNDSVLAGGPFQMPTETLY